MSSSSPKFGPLDEVLGTLLGTWNQRYRFEMNREERLLLLSKPVDNEVAAKELPDGRIHVVYFQRPDDMVEEICSVDRAIELVEALMSREQLMPISRV